MSQFRRELNSRIAEAQDSLARALDSGDEYLVGIRLGELESLARVAAEHGLQITGVQEALARHGLATPVMGVTLTIDRHQADLAAQHPNAGPGAVPA